MKINFKKTMLLLTLLLTALPSSCGKKKSEKADNESSVKPSSKKQTPEERDKEIRNTKLSPKMWNEYQMCIKIGQSQILTTIGYQNIKKRCTLYVHGLVTKKPIPHPYFKKNK